MATANQCFARGLGFDAQNSLCYYNGGKDGSIQYYEGDGSSVSAPFVASPASQMFPPNSSLPGGTNQGVPYNPAGAAVVVTPATTPATTAAPDWLSGIQNFLTAPAIFGIPTWAVIVGLGIAGYVLYSMETAPKGRGKAAAAGTGFI